jgi:hypothetical protein
MKNWVLTEGVFLELGSKVPTGSRSSESSKLFSAQKRWNFLELRNFGTKFQKVPKGSKKNSRR